MPWTNQIGKNPVYILQMQCYNDVTITNIHSPLSLGGAVVQVTSCSFLSPLKQTCVLLIVTRLGCLCIIVQKCVCGERDLLCTYKQKQVNFLNKCTFFNSFENRIFKFLKQMQQIQTLTFFKFH